MLFNILVTAVGCPGGPSIVKSLKICKKPIRLIGCDINKEVPAKFLIDKFYSVSSGTSVSYINDIIRIIKQENIDAVLPLSTFEVEKLSIHKAIIEKFGAKVIVSDYESISIANNKYKLYEYFKGMEFIPKYKNIATYKDFYNSVSSLGYPENKVVIKPCVGHGSRGVRIIDFSYNKYEDFIKNKPGSLFINIDEMYEILYKNDTSKLFISEYLPGKEYGVDLFIDPYTRKVVTGIVRDNGIVKHSSVDNGRITKYDELYLLASKIVEELGLIYTVNLDFKMNKNTFYKTLFKHSNKSLFEKKGNKIVPKIKLS